MPDLDAVLAAHVAWLRLLRRSERTIYERRRVVTRLAAWLSSTHNALTSQDKGGASEWLLHATAADLAAWRAALTVGDRAPLPYRCPIPELYPRAVRQERLP